MHSLRLDNGQENACDFVFGLIAVPYDLHR
jgi:hypothetical protein